MITRMTQMALTAAQISSCYGYFKPHVVSKFHYTTRAITTTSTTITRAITTTSTTITTTVTILELIIVIRRVQVADVLFNSLTF